MSKRGRPIKPNARRSQFRLRMNDQETNMLNSICDFTGLSVSEVLRVAVERMYEEEERFRKAFSEPLVIGKGKKE